MGTRIGQVCLALSCKVEAENQARKESFIVEKGSKRNTADLARAPLDILEKTQGEKCELC